MNLRDIRKEKKMTRVYVYAQTGIKPNTLSRKESGSRSWTVQEFQALCDLYGVLKPLEIDDYANLRK